MDNPQETGNLKWLGGFFDAEGSASFNYRPCIDINNTCPKTIFHVKKILNDIGIQAQVHDRPDLIGKSSKKLRWDLFLRHDEQIIPLLEKIANFIYGKQKQIQEILKWYKETNKSDIAFRLKYINQVNNIIIAKPDNIKKKLNITELKMYDDIEILTENNQLIETNDFNCVHYVAGLIDGEGCFSMNCRETKQQKTYRYTPYVFLNNTNKEMIKRYCSFLKNNQIGYHVQFRKPGVTSNRYRWDILVSGVKRSEKLCSLLKDYLITKKEQAELLNTYCIERLKNPKSFNESNGFEIKVALSNMKK